MKTQLLIILSCLLIVFSCKAQENYTTKNKKAIKLYENATKYYDAKDNEKAKAELEKALEKDPNFIEAYMLLAGVYTDMRLYEKAIEQFDKSFNINGNFFPNNYFSAGAIELKIGKYAEAKEHFEKFFTFERVDPALKKAAGLYLKDCVFALDALQHPVPFDPKNLGANINSPDYEYFPALTADDQNLIITRNTRSQSGMESQEDFFTSKKVNGEWSLAVSIGSYINTEGNEGAPTISADGQILIFSACDRPDGYGSCDIYFSKKNGDRWARPMNIGPPINGKYWDSQPGFSSDGKTLYFVSSRPGGSGDADIWQSTLTSKGTWGNPVNMGSNINSPGREESPYIHPDTRTLYYASNGLVGMGGTDVFVSKKDVKGDWVKSVNIGYPINTCDDENSLVVSGSGEVAYFSSDRKGGLGGLDLYYFSLYEGARPDKINYVKGKVYDSKTKKALGATFELIDLETAKTVIESESNNGNGEFLVCLPINKNYALNVSRSGYLFYSENFSLKDKTNDGKPFFMDVPLQAIDTGMTVELKNIFFETAKFDLKNESQAELQKLVNFLTANKTLRIEISGHTDNVGDKKLNQILSENRAKSVFDYLVKNGITIERLTYKGYGDSKPKVDNETAENRARNRRTEFKVLSK